MPEQASIRLFKISTSHEHVGPCVDALITRGTAVLPPWPLTYTHSKRGARRVRVVVYAVDVDDDVDVMEETVVVIVVVVIVVVTVVGSDVGCAVGALVQALQCAGH